MSRNLAQNANKENKAKQTTAIYACCSVRQGAAEDALVARDAGCCAEKKTNMRAIKLAIVIVIP